MPNTVSANSLRRWRSGGCFFKPIPVKQSLLAYGVVGSYQRVEFTSALYFFWEIKIVNYSSVDTKFITFRIPQVLELFWWRFVCYLPMQNCSWCWKHTLPCLRAISIIFSPVAEIHQGEVYVHVMFWLLVRFLTCHQQGHLHFQ